MVFSFNSAVFESALLAIQFYYNGRQSLEYLIDRPVFLAQTPNSVRLLTP